MTESQQEFDRQLERLLQANYHVTAKQTRAEFTAIFEPLRKEIQALTMPRADFSSGKIPFVIVVKSELVPIQAMIERLEFQNKPGVISMHPVKPEVFAPISSVRIPDAPAYLLLEINRGDDLRNIAPEQALQTLESRGRSPLTIDEGLAILTHYPEFLIKNHCFSLLGSRGGDRRVPALWISQRQAKLGWCWDGNPHTWLGSASAKARV
jgi:Family of unknown function (DUF5701)